jgi:uncharacterized protein
MIIDFSQHSEPEINFAHVYQSTEIDLNDETVRVVSPLRISGTARRNAIAANVKGNLQGHVELICDRCLQPLETEIETIFEVEYVTLNNYEQADKLSITEHELTSADFSLSIYDGERIDLDELTREQILLNLPARQLCQENCAGLCEKCGANKNTDDCSCETKEIDPRWSALKELKSKK